MLAAGGSQRLGRAKQLLRLRQQSLLARTVIRAGRLTPGRVIVVLGAERRRLRAHLRRNGLSPRIVSCPDWAAGQAVSLQAGLRAVPLHARRVMVLVCDQPLVRTRDLTRLLRHAPRAAVTAAGYAGVSGVPAVFARRVLSLLRQRQGDEGARQVLRGSRRTWQLAMPQATHDVDVPADIPALGLR